MQLIQNQFLIASGWPGIPFQFIIVLGVTYLGICALSIWGMLRMQESIGKSPYTIAATSIVGMVIALFQHPIAIPAGAATGAFIGFFSQLDRADGWQVIFESRDQ